MENIYGNEVNFGLDENQNLVFVDPGSPSVLFGDGVTSNAVNDDYAIPDGPFNVNPYTPNNAAVLNQNGLSLDFVDYSIYEGE